MKTPPLRSAAIQVTAVALGAVALDHATKFLVEKYFMLGECRRLIGDFLTLTYVRNPGVGFGLFGGLEWKWRAPFFAATAIGAIWILSRI